MAKLWLAEEGIDVKVMVETGLYDLECGPAGNEFLLSYDNMAQARRLTSVEDVLGALACGADNRCLGVLGAAQIDPSGNINSSRLATDRLLVGSGGANDIASSAAEVIVLSRCSRSRLVPKVDYVTSPGRAVLSVATDLCTLTRGSASDPWSIGSVYPAHGGRPLSYALEVIRGQCPWDLTVPKDLELAPIISTDEMRTVHTLDPRGAHWMRGGNDRSGSRSSGGAA
jgi:acyl CoA:acetate/3-ketoacid CoA transferase beta subunit